MDMWEIYVLLSNCASSEEAMNSDRRYTFNGIIEDGSEIKGEILTMREA